MNRNRIIVLCVILCVCRVSYAQTYATGCIGGAECELKILKGWHVSLEGELRCVLYEKDSPQFDRAKLGIATDYTFLKKWVKVGAAYNYLNYYNQEDNFYENRHRVKGYVTISQKFGAWKPSYRLQVQSTFRDERRGDYTFNPKTYMRNRFMVTWTVPRSPVKLYVSEEFWWRLYKPGDNIIDQLRSVIGVQYSFNKRHSMDVFFRSDNEVQVKNPKNVFSVGITYSFSGPLKFKRKKVESQEDSF